MPARLWRGYGLGFVGVRRRGAPGDVVAVVGVGGIGANAIQGAKLAGAKQIWAIDPVESKREKAMEFGATHTAASMDGGDGAARCSVVGHAWPTRSS